MNLEPFSVETPQGALALYKSSDSGRPQLLILHGGPGLGARSMFHGMSALADQFDLIFLDQRGDGDSQPAKDGDYSLDSYVSDVGYVLEAVSRPSREIGILGFSFGGCVAAHALTKFSVLSFGILAHTPVTWKEEHLPQLFQAHGVLEKAAEIQGRLFGESPKDEDMKLFVETVFGIYCPELTREEVVGLKDWVFRAEPFVKSYPQLSSTLDLRKVAPQIEVPCLVINSDKDAIVPSADGKELAELIEDASFIEMKDVGHFSFQKDPQHFASQVGLWHSEVRPPKPTLLYRVSPSA